MNDTKAKHRLRTLGLPPVASLDDLAQLTRVSASKLRYCSFRAEYLYKTFKIPKKNGKFRTIAHPSRELKAIQSWILRNILDKLSTSPQSKGFEIGQSILDNATPHIGANHLLNLDLQDFFESIKASKVYSIYSSIGYNKEVSTHLTNLTVFRGGLPQGAPSSPKLANLVAARLDYRINGYTGPRGIVYTRYADDITLSSPNVRSLQKARILVSQIIKEEDLALNKGKTKLSGTRRQKSVTGLVISENRAGIGRQKYREFRSKLHRIFLDRSTETSHMNGLLAYIHSVDATTYRHLCKYIDKLRKKYPLSKNGRDIRTI